MKNCAILVERCASIGAAISVRQNARTNITILWINVFFVFSNASEAPLVSLLLNALINLQMNRKSNKPAVESRTVPVISNIPCGIR